MKVYCKHAQQGNKTKKSNKITWLDDDTHLLSPQFTIFSTIRNYCDGYKCCLTFKYFLSSYHIIYMSALALMVCDTKAKTMSIFGYLIFERACRPIRFAQPRFVIVSSAIVQKCTICMRLRYSVNATAVCKHGSKLFYPLSHFFV